MPDLGAHAIVVGVAFGTVVLTTPLVKLLARRVGAVAMPDERRVHRRPTPSMGGLAIFAGVLAALGAASFLPAFHELFARTNEPEAVVLASLVIVAVGVLDDTREITAPAKLAGQILAAGCLVLFGLTLRFVFVPGVTILNLGPDLAAMVTIVAVVAMANAVNLVDGLDGLAAGIVTIAAIALFVYVGWGDIGARPIGAEHSVASLLLAAIVGACLGFLVYNTHPASVFMGDTGALLLGLLLAASGVSAIGTSLQPSGTDFFALGVPVLIPALVMAVPFVDTIWTVLRRLRTGKGVASPDKMHLHHRLVAIGHSQPRAVMIMEFWSALIAFAAVGGALLEARLVAIVIGTATGAAIGAWIAGKLRRALLRRHAASATRRTATTGVGIVYPFPGGADASNRTGEPRRRTTTDVP